MERKPKILWYQHKTSINLTIDHRDIKNTIVEFGDKKISIEFKSNGLNYKCLYDLENEIIPEECEKIINERNILIFMKKKEESLNWDYLVSNRENYGKNISVDWANWIDDSDDEPDNDMMNSELSINNSMEQLKHMPGGFDLLNNIGALNKDLNIGDSEGDIEEIDGINDISEEGNNEKEDINDLEDAESLDLGETNEEEKCSTNCCA